jgi:hypothetical protein
LSGQVANQRLVELTTVEEHGEFYEDAGEFLPVGVWAARGFDAESIVNKSLPKDKKMHPVLGETFRVCVLRKGHRGAKTVVKSDKLAAAGSVRGSSVRLRLRLVFVFQPQEVEEVQEGGEEGEEGREEAEAEAVLLSAEGFVEFKLFLGSSIIKRPSR